MYRRNKNFIISFLLLAALSFPLTTLADIKSYKLEQGIPFIGGAGTTLSYGDFNNLFKKFITAAYIIAAVAAFIKILIAGIRWYTSGGSAKAISQAREDIKNGIIGLCFIFLAGILIEFINPNLNKLSDIYTPHAGQECLQVVASNNGSGVLSGSLKQIDSNHYAIGTLVDAIKSTKKLVTITTGCRNNNSCDPDYCVKNKQYCHTCSMDSNSCAAPLTQTPCHFNGTCVDLVPIDDSGTGYALMIGALNAAGLDVLDERASTGCATAATTSDHLLVALPGVIQTTGACVHYSGSSFNPNP